VTPQDIVPLLVPVYLASLRDLDGAIVDDAQPRAFMGMLWIVAGCHDYFADLQPEAIGLWKPTADQGLELDAGCGHGLPLLLDVEVETSTGLMVVGFGMGRNGRPNICFPTEELALVI
jgi:hypothetical protein